MLSGGTRGTGCDEGNMECDSNSEIEDPWAPAVRFIGGDCKVRCQKTNRFSAVIARFWKSDEGKQGRGINSEEKGTCYEIFV